MHKRVSRILWAAAALGLGWGLSSGAWAGEPAAGRRRPIPFPAGYGFPADPKHLEALVKKGDAPALRRHGWNLWAGVNQPGRDGWPIWRSWYIPTQAFAPVQGASAPVKASAAGPGQGTSMKAISQKNNPKIDLGLPLYLIPDAVRAKHREALQNITKSADIPDGESFQNNGDLMLVSEPYSLEGYQDIRRRKLYEGATLDAMLAAGKTDIPPMNPRTIVLKHMYWPVKREGYTALPIAEMRDYDKPGEHDTTYLGFENLTRWSKAVAIDPRRAPIPPGATASVTYLHDVRQPPPNQTKPMGPNTYLHAKVVPITDFYHRKLTAQDYRALSTYDKVLLDASFYWVHGRMFEPGDYLVSVGSHIITKEMPSWTLQTFWWSDRPDEGPYAQDRPDIRGAKGPWRHYLMAIEYGIPARPGGDTLPIAYNPYIELASHPVVTNCRNCHVRAAWPSGQYMQSPGPNALANIQLNNPIFEKRLRVDFLWTIKDRAIKAQKPPQ